MTHDDLFKIALLGTARCPLPENFKHIETDDAAQFLKIYAIHLLECKAGWVPLSIANQEQLPKTTAEIETLSYCSLTALPFLRQMLQGGHIQALPEFLQYLNANSLLLPPEVLPEILDFCVKEKKYWHFFKSVIGKRGEWLALLRPQWANLLLLPTLDPEIPLVDATIFDKILIDARKNKTLVLEELKTAAYFCHLDILDELLHNSILDWFTERTWEVVLDIIRFRNNFFKSL